MTVLVIEDSEDIQWAIANILDYHRVPYAMMDNIKDGLDWLATKERPCMILLDLIMPHMDGRCLLATLRTDDLFRGVPVVVQTAPSHQNALALSAHRPPADAEDHPLAG